MSLSHRAAHEGPPVPPDEALAALTGPSAPYLVGVRHHAPSLAAALPALLDEAKPQVLLVELPAEMQQWLPWLGHEETRAPVALAAAPVDGGGGGGGPAFYPFADFSPELAAVRWAARHDVPVVACDLPLADPAWAEGRRAAATGAGGPGLATAVRSRLTGRPGDDLWDRLVEATAPGSPPEALRRAALLTGWALREDAAASGGVPELDLRRESWMRARLAEATARGERAAAVVGAFHAPALLRPDAGEDTAPDRDPGRPGWTTSLIPYTYALLDERSGYPAGIRDPEWQDMVLRAGGDPEALEEALTRAAVRICAELRGLGHPSGPADAREISRLASDLARLRGLPAAGRGELVEAVQTVLAQGEPYGRGRAVARAMERVLVGTRSGRPAARAPRSGLAPAVEAEAALLGLPGPETDGHSPGPARDLRLDPLRSDLDRRRELLLRRLAVCGVPYGEAREVVGAGGAEARTSRWEVRWTPATAAVLTAAGIRGVTAAQAAEGVLRERRHQERDEGGPTAAQALEGLVQAAECGLNGLADERLGDVADVLPGAGTLPELLAGLALLDRLRAGHVPGLGCDTDREARAAAVGQLLTAAAVRQVDGLTGSEDLADAHALLELAHRADLLGGIRLADALDRLSADGSPLMRGAAGAVRVLLGHEDARTFGDRVASWIDGATDPDSRTALTARIGGLLSAAGPLLETAEPALEPLLTRVTELPDREFLDRLPALRGGFDTLSPAARDRLLAAVDERLGTAHIADTDGVDPAALAAWTAADFTARERLRSLGLVTDPSPAPAEDTPPDGTPRNPGSDAPQQHTPSAVPQPPPEPGRAPEPGVTTRPAAAAGPEPDTRPGPAARPGPQGTARPGAEDTAHSPGTGPGADAVSEPGVRPTAPSGTRGAVPSGPAVTAPRGQGRDARTAPGAVVRPGPGGALVGGVHPAGAGDTFLAPADRWRLLLGRRTDTLPSSAAPLATALDELYGSGRGEGSRGSLAGRGTGGGRQAPYPGVREWSEELAALFGPGIREEVLAAAAASGRTDVLTELDADAARPSVDLLRTVLRHAGGLPEARLAALRPLVRRLVDALARQLATRLRPALHGTTLPRPSRRPGGGLDLPRTLRANLATARRGPDGTVRVIPERPVFRTRGRRAADWRLILVTDVSGSMEASTVWAALTASVLAGVPTLSTHFLAFSTEVIDLTGHVDDPLSLLLEVSVGGGTHIAAGLRHARELVTVPSRTLVVVVSDFEEGYPLGGLLAEVRALVSAGCHVLGCASLDDTGRPRYSTGVAGRLVAAGMPVAALSPLELARWVGEKIA
ncbi:DUF5682 family protein [Streptomyces cathayae]|uniref:DUF5682 family protein n=1 Tax=Streptomyces cathayae TaxID=3031124 RepID=A0ABY8KDW0_9ACTN|nr:DUF5682 family protein [Streptomyces sp. HUAS 5]WGD44693.1 DUF5682 family protein [Streptomyces sp. HUAS 5]